MHARKQASGDPLRSRGRGAVAALHGEAFVLQGGESDGDVVGRQRGRRSESCNGRDSGELQVATDCADDGGVVAGKGGPRFGKGFGGGPQAGNNLSATAL